jgi:hypothetical protein
MAIIGDGIQVILKNAAILRATAVVTNPPKLAHPHFSISSLYFSGVIPQLFSLCSAVEL